MSLTNPLKVHLLGKRTINIDEQPQYQVGDDTNWLALYPEITPTEDTGSAICTDSNTIFVDGVGGDDDDDGTSANPVLTIVGAGFRLGAKISAGLTDFQYICAINNDYTFVEMTSIPAYATFYYQGSITVAFRRVGRSLPSSLTDANTKWVDPISGNDTGSPTPGTEANPLKTIQAAMDSITTNAFTTIAVKVNSNGSTSITENLNFIQDISTVDQTVAIVPYTIYNSTNQAGASLTMNFNTSQSVQQIGTFTSAAQKDYLVSSNFDANNEKICFFVSNGSTNATQYTKDFINVTSVATSTSQNWECIAEYYYDGDWYILAFSYINATTIKVFYAKGPGFTTKGEYNLTVTGATSEINAVKCPSGTRLILTCGTGIHYLPINTDNTSSAGWVTNAVTADDTIRGIYAMKEGEFIATHGQGSEVSKVYYYKKDVITEYDFGITFENIFAIDNIIYGCSGYLTDTITIYELDFVNTTALQVTTYTGYFDTVANCSRTVWTYQDLAYWINYDSSVSPSTTDIIIFDGATTKKITIDSAFTGTANNCSNFHYNGLLFGENSAATTVDCIQISQISSIVKIAPQSIYFNGGGTYGCNLAFLENGSNINYCRYKNHVGIDATNDFNGGYYSYFECDYSIIAGEPTSAATISYSAFLGVYDSNTSTRNNFKTAIKNLSSYDITINHCTLYQGNIGLAGEGDYEYSILYKVGEINKNNSTVCNVDESSITIPYKYNDCAFTNTLTGNIYLRDPSGEFPKLELQKVNVEASNDKPYKFDSNGIEQYEDSGSTNYGNGYSQFILTYEDSGCYVFTRNEYSRTWEYEFECDLDVNFPVNKTNLISMFNSINGKTYISKTEGGRRVAIWWKPKNIEEFNTYREVLDNIISYNAPAYLYLNSWLDLTNDEINTYAAQNDLGIMSGQATNTNTYFDPDDLVLVQDTHTWVPNRYNGFLAYIKYVAGEPGTTYENYYKIKYNTETTLYLEDTEYFEARELEGNQISTNLYYVIGAIKVDIAAEELQTQVSNIMASGMVIPDGGINLTFEEA